jgi:hypothetical protein
MPRFVAILLGVLFLLAVSAASASAQTVLLTGPGDFSGSESLLTFDDLGLASGEAVGDVDGVAFMLDDATAPAYFEDTFPREFDPQGMGSVVNFMGSTFPFPDLTMQLPGVMQRVGFAARFSPADEVRVVLLLDGEMVDELIMPGLGSDQAYFYGFENEAGFDEILVDAVAHNSGAFVLDNLSFESLGGDPDPGGPIVLSCDGFHAPWDAMLEHSKGRHLGFWKDFGTGLPLRVLWARLLDGDGASMGDTDLVAPPVVYVDFFGARGADPVDVTDDVLDGSHAAFGYDADADMWHTTLPRGRMRGRGVYVLTAESGDEEEYTVDPTCSAWVARGQNDD